MCAGGIAPALVPLRRGIAPESRTAAGVLPREAVCVGVLLRQTRANLRCYRKATVKLLNELSPSMTSAGCSEPKANC